MAARKDTQRDVLIFRKGFQDFEIMIKTFSKQLVVPLTGIIGYKCKWIGDVVGRAGVKRI